MSNQESELSSIELLPLLKDIEFWYYERHISFLIAHKCYRREFAILSADAKMRRTLRVHTAQNFEYIFRIWRVIMKFSRKKGLDKFYHSTAHYFNPVPYQNPDLSSNVVSKIWLSESWKFMDGYDLFIDIDGETHDDFKAFKESMIKIHEFFSSINLPHEIFFSGCGFHIVVPFQYLPKLSLNPEEKNNIYDYCRKKAIFLHDKFSEMVDTSVYDSKRLMKCPYTLAQYGKDLYVCTPITTESKIYDCTLEDFKIGSVNIDNGFKLFYDKTKEVKLWVESEQPDQTSQTG